MTTTQSTPRDAVPELPAQPPATETTTRVDFERGTGVPPFTAVLWDLDGTIVDSAAGITSAIARMLESFGLPVPGPIELRSYVGPPILDSFKLHGLDREIGLDRAIERYREFYRENGELSGAVFPGMAEAIRAVHAAGIPQSTATSKPESAATRILEHFDLADQFDVITGASDDETRSAKGDVVAEALRRLDERGVDLSNVIMVGDRFYDVQGAGENGVPTIYTTWGYGQEGEEVGSVGVAATPEQLLGFLGLDGHGRAAGGE